MCKCINEATVLKVKAGRNFICVPILNPFSTVLFIYWTIILYTNMCKYVHMFISLICFHLTFYMLQKLLQQKKMLLCGLNKEEKIELIRTKAIVFYFPGLTSSFDDVITLWAEIRKSNRNVWYNPPALSVHTSAVHPEWPRPWMWRATGMLNHQRIHVASFFHPLSSPSAGTTGHAASPPLPVHQPSPLAAHPGY